MANVQQDAPAIQRLVQLGASAFEGVIFAVLNKVMLTFFAAMGSTSVVQSSEDSVQLLQQMQLEWVIVYYLMAYQFPVLLAYGTMGGGALGWVGVAVYTIAWLFIAANIPNISAGIGPLLLAIFLLAGWTGLRMYLTQGRSSGF